MAAILCVDEELANGVALESALTGLGHTPVLATNLPDAISALAGHRFDLVIADNRLLDRSGAVLSLLSASTGDVPLIVTTGFSAVEPGTMVLPCGAIDYLTNPVGREALRIAVSQVLEVVRLRKENESYRREVSSFRRNSAIEEVVIDDLRAPPVLADEQVLDLDELERIAIQRALAVAGGIRTRAAKLLGISERTLRNKLNTPKATPTR